MVHVNVPLEDSVGQRKSRVNKTWKDLIMLGLEKAEEEVKKEELKKGEQL